MPAGHAIHPYGEEVSCPVAEYVPGAHGAPKLMSHENNKNKKNNNNDCGGGACVLFCCCAMFNVGVVGVLAQLLKYNIKQNMWLSSRLSYWYINW